MTQDIAFLHTSPVHVATFDALVSELAPGLRAGHRVREDLLAEAQSVGIEHLPLIARVHEALADAARDGARVVVCTCSTLGGIAEAADGQGTYRVTRVDRAMADHAVGRARPVLLVAALESTLAPTADLLRSSAIRLGAQVLIEPLLVPGAWGHFQGGRVEAYLDSIATAVLQAARPDHTIVLAQASMAGAAERLAAQGLHVLTSPRLGAHHAVMLAATALA